MDDDFAAAAWIDGEFGAEEAKEDFSVARIAVPE